MRDEDVFESGIPGRFVRAGLPGSHPGRRAEVLSIVRHSAIRAEVPEQPQGGTRSASERPLSIVFIRFALVDW